VVPAAVGIDEEDGTMASGAKGTGKDSMPVLCDEEYLLDCISHFGAIVNGSKPHLDVDLASTVQELFKRQLRRVILESK
jgi:hypothetical protein